MVETITLVTIVPFSVIWRPILKRNRHLKVLRSSRTTRKRGSGAGCNLILSFSFTVRLASNTRSVNISDYRTTGPRHAAVCHGFAIHHHPRGRCPCYSLCHCRLSRDCSGSAVLHEVDDRSWCSTAASKGHSRPLLVGHLPHCHWASLFPSPRSPAPRAETVAISEVWQRRWAMRVFSVGKDT